MPNSLTKTDLQWLQTAADALLRELQRVFASSYDQTEKNKKSYLDMTRTIRKIRNKLEDMDANLSPKPRVQKKRPASRRPKAGKTKG